MANVQVSVPVPIFNRNQGNIAAAEADWLRASQEKQRLQLALKQMLADVYRGYDIERNNILQYNQAILPNSFETLKLSQQAYENGEIGYLQYLTAQRNYTALNQDYIDSLGRLWSKVVEIDGLLLVDGLKSPERIP